MRITDLSIKNFRGMKDGRFGNLPEAAFFTGPNGAGKTSLLNAVRFLLFGRCFNAKGARILNRNLVGEHGPKAELQMTILEPPAAEWRFIAEITKTSSTFNLFQGDIPMWPELRADEVRAKLWEALGIPMQHAECAANPMAYLLGDELGAMLAEVCGATVDEAALQEHCGDNYPWVKDWLGKLPVEHAGSKAEEDRKQAKKDLAAAEAALKALEEIEPPVAKNTGKPMTAKDLDGTKALLKKLHSDRDVLVVEQSECRRHGGPEGVEKRRAEIEVALSGAQSATDTTQHDAAIAKARETVDALQGRESATSQKLNTLRERKTEIVTGRSVFDSQAAKCPTCRREVTDKVRAEILKRFDADLETLNTDLEGKRGELDSITRELTAARDALGQAMQLKSALESGQADEARKQAALRAELERLPKSLRPLVDIEKNLAALEERYQTGFRIAETLEKLAQLPAAQDKAEGLRERVAMLEWAVKQFRDGELLNAVLSDKKAAFEDEVNTTLERFGYELEVRIDGKLVECWIGKTKHVKMPIAELSEGELVIAQWAVSSAFSAGAPMMIDNADGLSYENKLTLMTELKSSLEFGSTWFSGAWGVPDKNLASLCQFLAPATAIWIEAGKGKYSGTADAEAA